jgi:hypothetical protein
MIFASPDRPRTPPHDRGFFVYGPPITSGRNVITTSGRRPRRCWLRPSRQARRPHGLYLRGTGTICPRSPGGDGAGAGFGRDSFDGGRQRLIGENGRERVRYKARADGVEPKWSAQWQDDISLTDNCRRPAERVAPSPAPCWSASIYMLPA